MEKEKRIKLVTLNKQAFVIVTNVEDLANVSPDQQQVKTEVTEFGKYGFYLTVEIEEINIKTEILFTYETSTFAIAELLQGAPLLLLSTNLEKEDSTLEELSQQMQKSGGIAFNIPDNTLNRISGMISKATKNGDA